MFKTTTCLAIILGLISWSAVAPAQPATQVQATKIPKAFVKKGNRCLQRYTDCGGWCCPPTAPRCTVSCPAANCCQTLWGVF